VRKVYGLTLTSLIALLLLFPSLSFAQSVGSISGTVYDSTGARVTAARVTARNLGTNAERTIDTGSDGRYVFTLLPIGTYAISVKKDGFRPVLLENQQLEGQQNLTLNHTLQPIGETQQVTVTSEAPGVEIQRSDATLNQTIHAEQVASLPLNGRDFAQLALLAPGTVKAEQPGDALIPSKGSEVSFRGAISLSVQGMSENSNDWQLDGVDDNELTAGAVGFLPQLDAISEFNVLTFNYSAQYGYRGGSTVLVNTKSGTNAFHGSAFEFLRNDILDARNYFDGAAKSKYIQNEFGFSLGGPIFRDKTFFFADLQSNRIRQGEPTLSVVPTANQRNGIFTGTPIYEPSSTYGGSAGGAPLQRTEFPNDTIPHPDPVGQAVINLYPLPNYNGGSGYNYFGDPVEKLNDTEFDVRLDHQLTSRDHAFARFSWDDGSQFTPSGLPGFGAANPYESTETLSTHARNIAISNTHVFSPHVINQVTAGYNRDFNYIRSYGYNTNIADQLGIPGANISGNSATSGMPMLTMTGYNPIGDRLYSPYQGGTNIFHYWDALTVVEGSHSLKFGFELRPNQSNLLGEPAFAGTMDFTPQFTAQFTSGNAFDPSTGNAIASALLGLPQDGSRSNQYNSSILGRRWKEFRGYAEDNWQVTPSLTLNLGFAYGVTPPLREAENRYANFDIVSGQFYVAGGADPGEGIHAGPRVGIQTDYSNAEPRFGFAFSPRGVDHGIALRGGYAIFHDLSQQGITTGLQWNPPYTSTYSFSSDNINPVRTLNTGFPENGGLADLTTYTGNLVSQDRHFKQGLVQQYNLNLQQELPYSSVFTLAYAATHATRIFNQVSNMNPATPGDGTNPASRRPYPQYETVYGIESNGWLGYNSLQAKLERRAASGLYLLAAYTYSKTINNGYRSGVTSPPGAAYYPLLPYPNADRGLAPLSLTNNFTASFLYPLPFGKGQQYLSSAQGISQAVLGGWSVNGIIVAHSGFPLAFVEDVNNSGAGVSSRPDQLCSNPVAQNPTVFQWLNPSCFAEAPQGLLGDAPISSGYGPRQTNVDFSAFKSFPIFREQQLQFRAELFNVFNHSQFATPDQNFGDGTFGAISATVNNNRQVQFALKYLF
jgi:Carboxypeptidase regulatory-like domain